MHLLDHRPGKLVLPELLVPHYDPHDPSLRDLMDVARRFGAEMALTYLAATYAANMLSAVTTTGLFMGLNSASPGTTGANELVPGTAYTGNRPAVTWAAASTGVQVSSDTQTFAILVTQASGIPYWSLWTASTAGTYLFGGATSGASSSVGSGSSVTCTSAITLIQAG